ncbi:MAG: hypothetical protein ABJF23_32675 [Bryobacteraceae bacterium]
MERRIFLTIVGTAGLLPQPSSGLQLTAIAAEHLPQSAVLHGYAEPDAGTIFELRRYEGTLPAAELLARHGIQRVFEDNSTILLSFANLIRRDEAWSALASDPDWQAQRSSVTQLTLYQS